MFSGMVAVTPQRRGWGDLQAPTHLGVSGRSLRRHLCSRGKRQHQRASSEQVGNLSAGCNVAQRRSICDAARTLDDDPLQHSQLTRSIAVTVGGGQGGLDGPQAVCPWLLQGGAAEGAGRAGGGIRAQGVGLREPTAALWGYLRCWEWGTGG